MMTTSNAVIGCVTGIDNACLLGWARRENHPNQPLSLIAVVDGNAHPCSTGYDCRALNIPETGSTGFIVPLDHVDTKTDRHIRILCADSGQLMYQGGHRQDPVIHANGNRARDILELHAAPLVKLQYFRFQGDTLTLFGFAQPSATSLQLDARAIAVHCESQPPYRVSSHIATPPGHDQVFWYLPGASYFGLGIDIDLAQTTPTGDGLEIVISGNVEHDTDPIQRLAKSTWWPYAIDAYAPYPDQGRLERVHDTEDRHTVAMGGFSDARRLGGLFEIITGECLQDKRILDWGCGHGRVIRHLARGGRNACYGIDIDPDNVRWAQSHIGGVQFDVSDLLPPSPYPDEHFDFIYGISVMTHLMPDVQQAWLAELRRILRKNGACILTFNADSSVAYSSRFLGPEWIAAYRQRGWNWISYDNFTGHGAGDYYRNVHQRIECVRRDWANQFDVIGIHPAVFGYQDIAVLKR